MNNVIRFLDQIGRNADLRLDRMDVESILFNDEFDEETTKAILNNDHRALEVLLNARSKIVCMIVPAEEEEEEEENEDEGTKKNDSEEENANFNGKNKQLSQAS